MFGDCQELSGLFEAGFGMLDIGYSPPEAVKHFSEICK